jgi:hypothetical protein
LRFSGSVHAQKHVKTHDFGNRKLNENSSLKIERISQIRIADLSPEGLITEGYHLFRKGLSPNGF